MRLIGEIVGKYAGPCIIIGGGPSVPGDLASLPDNFDPAVISANAHGFKQRRFPVLFSVCNDPMHDYQRKPMDRVIREAGGNLIISPCHFADYRIPGWKVHANTGLTAIAVAVALGFAPVIVTGIDCFGTKAVQGDKRPRKNQEATYFWDRKGESNSNRKTPDNFHRQITKIKQLVQDAQVRPMSGPLLDFWPAYDAAEPASHVLPPYALQWRKERCVIVETLKSKVTWHYMQVPRGTRIATTEEESARYLRDGRVRVVE
jgi:hypothetical protein